MNRYEMEPILTPTGRFVIYGDHLNAVEKLEARIAELEGALAHWEGNAYRASDKCEELKARVAGLESGIKAALAEIESGCYADAHSTISSL